MSSPVVPPPVHFKAPSPEKTLRKLFLTVFLRGQSSRGLTKDTVPKSLASKLWLMLLIYAGMGGTALFMITQQVLLLSIYLHSLTFLALGMLIGSSAGEALFNKEEGDILMHRPVTSQMLLRAKASVLIQVSLYMAGALNIVGTFVGLASRDGGWLFPFAHVLSTVESTLFSVGAIILMYQLCLRWLGRERVEGIMTTMQVLMIVSITVGSQILPRAIGLRHGMPSVNLDAWWLKILPPTWFASLDDAIGGSRSQSSWLLAGWGIIATGLILWLGFGKLASAYESGMQTLNEAAPIRTKQRGQFRVVKVLSESIPLRWFLRSSVSKASFQLVSAYLFRDRDTKLRLYPGIAPMMVMPVMMLVTNHGIGGSASGRPDPSGFTSGFSNFFLALSGVYLCLIPLSALNLLKFSQQWRAADVFIAAPLVGPAQILQGARVAVVSFLALPMLLGLAIFAAVTQGFSSLWVILPGVIALPVYALIPGIIGNATPLSNPLEEAKSMNNMPIMMVSMLGAFGVAGAATAAAAVGFLPLFLIAEVVVSGVLCFVLNSIVAKSTWRVYD